VQDVGASQGVQNTVFLAVIAGDSDRAAYFFRGSTTPGPAVDKLIERSQAPGLAISRPPTTDGQVG
jgi:hypothetical protein